MVIFLPVSFKYDYALKKKYTQCLQYFLAYDLMHTTYTLWTFISLIC